MPNLTSYKAPPIHLNRELPKTYCDLLRHEIDYNKFLRKRISTIRSSLLYTKKISLKKTNKWQQRKYFDHNQCLFQVYKHNIQLCQKILRIWSNNGKQQGGVDCHNENYKKQTKISQFCLQQKQWRDNTERENKRFIRSLTYHQKTYKPAHDRRIAYKAYQRHLRLLKAMSHGPKYNNLMNSRYKTLPDYDSRIHEYFHSNYNKLYRSSSYITLPAQCQTLPMPYKLNKKQKIKTIKFKFNEPEVHKQSQSNRYKKNLAQQTMKNAISIYSQPLPSALNCIKSSFSINGEKLKLSSSKHQESFQSFSCQDFLDFLRYTQ